MDRIQRVGPILALIREHEAPLSAQRQQGVSSAYDVVWSKIAKKDRTRLPITKLTVAQVLRWQDILDPYYLSEAAGAYQFMEDTLRTLRFNPQALFNAKTQDELALQLLDRRGWKSLEAGLLTPEGFANNLAKEWASFPVVTDMRGAKRNVRRGQSYYSGDGLNKAYVQPEAVMAAIHQALGKPAVDPDAIPISEVELAYVANLVEWVNHAPAKAAPEKELRAWRGVMPEKEAA